MKIGDLGNICMIVNLSSMILIFRYLFKIKNQYKFTRAVQIASQFIDIMIKRIKNVNKFSIRKVTMYQ